MKFKLLRVFVFAFACIVGTCCVPVWADDGVTCGDGQYLDNAECKDCPLVRTNAEGKVGPDKRFDFTVYNAGKGERVGITSCAVKLNPSKDSCAKETEVVYVYDVEQKNYIRKVSNVFSLPTSLINNLPATDNMDDPFCTPCGTDEPYNFGGVCDACTEARRYLEVIDKECNFTLSGPMVCYDKYRCSTCPAGYYCPGVVYKTDNNGNKVCKKDNNGDCLKDNNGAIVYDTDPEKSQKAILCSENTYSEGGADQCTSCPMGYFTSESGPTSNGFDGLCLYNRIYDPCEETYTECTKNDYNDGCLSAGCISPDACKLTMAELYGGNLPKDKLKIESINASVIEIGYSGAP